jgi:hypothetical protein
MIQLSYEELLKPYLERTQDWQLKFAVVPQRCAISGQRIWLKNAYRGTRTITGPGTPITQHHWIKANEFIVWKLKGIK